jgi:hypothetical protein
MQCVHLRTVRSIYMCGVSGLPRKNDVPRPKRTYLAYASTQELIQGFLNTLAYLPQKLHLRPNHRPTKGISTIDASCLSCSKLSSHSRWAIIYSSSESYPSDKDADEVESSEYTEPDIAGGLKVWSVTA